MRKARANLISLRKCQEIFFAICLRLRFKDNPVAAISRYSGSASAEIAAQTNSRTPQEFPRTRRDGSQDEIGRDSHIRGSRGSATRNGRERGCGIGGSLLHLAPNNLGVASKRANHAAWEFPFLSVIDCRGWKAAPAATSLSGMSSRISLTLTNQRRLVFAPLPRDRSCCT